jgi:KUP system potassium uptake protein
VLVHLVERTGMLPKRVFLVTVSTDPVPHVDPEHRVQVTPLEGSFTRVVARYGFMEDPDVPDVVKRAYEKLELPYEPRELTYYLGREAVLGHDTGAMGRFAEGLFGFLQRNAVAADQAFRIPPQQAIEIGIQVDL